MADITNELKEIKAANWGGGIRSAIASALEKVNHSGGDGGSSLKNIVDAENGGIVEGLIDLSVIPGITEEMLEEYSPNQATGQFAHAEGGSYGVEDGEIYIYLTTASGECSHAEGGFTTASGDSSHAEGGETTASGVCSHAEGEATTASGECSHAEGGGTTASGDGSHAEGNGAKALGVNSHAEGVGTTASGDYSHAEGATTTASGVNSHAEGATTTASGVNSHAEGVGTIASGDHSHAEGGGTTTASGDYSHAEGSGTTASGNRSHAEGSATKATSRSQHVFGEFNIEDQTGTASTRGTYVEIVGNGTAGDSRSNARTLDWNGNESIAGSLTLGKGTANETTITPTQLAALLALLN